MINWEMIYTEADSDDEFLVDNLTIDMENKRYILDISVDGCITDSIDENGEPYGCSSYVSKKLFNFVLQALKDANFKQAKWVDFDDEE
jgi:hypothetical protein